MPGYWEEEPWEEDGEDWEDDEGDWDEWFLDTYDGMMSYIEFPDDRCYYWDDLHNEWVLVA